MYKIMTSQRPPTFSSLAFTRREPDEMLTRATEFREQLAKRRTVRDFSGEPVAKNIIEECIRAAGSAPSGANRQPWHFAVISDPELKRKIRLAAEAEEKEFYENRAPEQWLQALAPLGTNADKPFLETAPYLIVVFAEKYGLNTVGQKQKNYYVTESVGIACGMLLTALHTAGLATLTHTPSPMKFLNELLHRPVAEKPLMIIVTGFPAADTSVPDISRKSLDAIASFFENSNSEP